MEDMRNGRKGEYPDLPFFMWRGEGRKKDTTCRNIIKDSTNL